MNRFIPCVMLALLATVTNTLAAAPAEFRGVWIATVSNIDWPSKPGLTLEEQKHELEALFDKCKKLNLNAVVFQVRPMCDALYASKLEPWSIVLTGTPGADPGYDPLMLAVELAHARSMELHAWINPYRAWHPTGKAHPSETHLVKARPDLAKRYGKHFWLNPTSVDVQKHTLAVVKDIVTRYDIDGIHMDDYFYPYPELDEHKKELPFPDDDTWADYQKAGGKLARDDWRRDAVNHFVKTMYRDVHDVKPWVKVGISPFGIWKPNHPEGIAGFNQHDKLYADARLWLREGWVDYFTPQLYWGINQEKQSYPKLLKWWAGENVKGRHLWIGNGTYRHSAGELQTQIVLTRREPGVGGNVHFSLKAITGEKAEMLERLYDEPAAVPETPWLPKQR